MPVETRFSATVKTDPGVHPACYVGGTELFPAVKQLEPGVENPLPSSAEVTEIVELYLNPFPSRHGLLHLINFTLLHLMFTEKFTYQTSVDGSRPSEYDTVRTVNIYGLPGRKVLLLCTM
jgi:hypothetical protein